MTSKAQPAPPPPPPDLTTFPTFILDNGANSMKAGFASAESPKVIPNCIAKSRSERRRPFLGDQIDDCRDTSGLFFLLPVQKGYMTHPDFQKTVWDYLFGKESFDINPQDVNLLITEPICNFRHIQDVMCEILFEDYEFNSVCRTTAANMTDFKYSTEMGGPCSLIIDSGHSFTHIVPYINGNRVTTAMKRIDIGGKAVTNHLKEVISYRQLHVLDETFLMNQVKEDLSFISLNYNQDLEICKKKFPQNNIMRDYILPDYSKIKRGFIRPVEKTGQKAEEAEQILKMNNERFTVPEILFRPPMVGINQEGISQAVLASLKCFEPEVQKHFVENIVLTGGNVNIPGFKERIELDLRSDIDAYFTIKSFVPPNPVTYSWEAAKIFSKDPEFSRYLVTKSQYAEYGRAAFAKNTQI